MSLSVNWKQMEFNNDFNQPFSNLVAVFQKTILEF